MVRPGLPPGLTINTTTGVISGTIDNSASLTDPYTNPEEFCFLRDKIVEWLRKRIEFERRDALDPDALAALEDVTDRINKGEYRW